MRILDEGVDRQMITILNAKLLIPDTTETVLREGLRDRLEEVPRKKLTTVVAGAGYGKTTLVAQTVRYSEWKTVWYRLGESDQDLPTFSSYLIAGLSKIAPSFCEEIDSLLDTIGSPKSAPEEIVTLLIGELEKVVAHDLFIVLEDYHLVAESPEIKSALAFLLENLPSNLYVIIISRNEPELPLSRLRATREIVEIKTEDLAFTDSETDRLCAKLFGTSLQEENVKVLRQKAAGWVTGKRRPVG